MKCENYYIKNDQPINSPEVISGTVNVLKYVLSFCCPEMKLYENQIKLFVLNQLLKDQEQNDYLKLPKETFLWTKAMLKKTNFEGIVAGNLLKRFEDGLTEKPENEKQKNNKNSKTKNIREGHHSSNKELPKAERNTAL
jgi:hypothetical protein